MQVTRWKHYIEIDPLEETALRWKYGFKKRETLSTLTAKYGVWIQNKKNSESSHIKKYYKRLKQLGTKLQDATGNEETTQTVKDVLTRKEN